MKEAVDDVEGWECLRRAARRSDPPRAAAGQRPYIYIFLELMKFAASERGLNCIAAAVEQYEKRERRFLC